MNTGPGPQLFKNTGKVCETAKFAAQLANTATPMAVPRTLSGRTSGSMTHTTGPQVAAKETMKPARHSSVMMASGSLPDLGCASTAEVTPRMAMLEAMPNSPGEQQRL